MAKIEQTNVLAKLKSGKLGQTVLWTPKKSKSVYSRKRYNDSPGTALQTAWREEYAKVDVIYKTLTEDEKNSWRGRIKRKAMSNYAIYMHYNLLRARKGLPVVRRYEDL